MNYRDWTIAGLGLALIGMTTLLLTRDSAAQGAAAGVNQGGPAGAGAGIGGVKQGGQSSAGARANPGIGLGSSPSAGVKVPAPSVQGQLAADGGSAWVLIGDTLYRVDKGSDAVYRFRLNAGSNLPSGSRPIPNVGGIKPPPAIE